MINESKYIHINRFSVAPMIDWTDRHCRYFLRLLSRQTCLYTEMVTTGAILRGDEQSHLSFDPVEKPLVLQLGGSDPVELARCSELGEQYGYNEINLNIGCPSSRVQSGKFGACLMKEPGLVADCIAAMKSRTSIPVTIKTRIGVDDHDSYENLKNFIDLASLAGCQTFIIHARKAWLKGLSPKENREIPPLNYETVKNLKQDFPNLNFILNGGIKSLEEAKILLQTFSGVMLGRAVKESPYLLNTVDQEIFNSENISINKKVNTPVNMRENIFKQYIPYLEYQRSMGVPYSILIRPVIGLFQGQPGAKSWRRLVTQSPEEIVKIIKNS